LAVAEEANEAIEQEPKQVKHEHRIQDRKSTGPEVGLLRF
jgi:hypothetical protein